MSYEKYCLLLFLMIPQTYKQILKLCTCNCIKCSKWLIHQKNRWVNTQRSCNGTSLFHTTRKCLWKLLKYRLIQSDFFHHI